MNALSETSSRIWWATTGNCRRQTPDYRSHVERRVSVASARRSRPTEQQRHRFRRERSTRSIMTASLRAYQATTGFPRPVVNRTGCVAGNRPVPVLSRHSQDIVIVTNCADPDVALGRSPANPAYRRCGQRASTDPPLCSGPALTQPRCQQDQRRQQVITVAVIARILVLILVCRQ